MTARQIRQTFLDFFASKGHTVVPSAPLVIKDDPTLMFTNAGMNPFKDVFLGVAPVVHPRIADTQKCLRVSGKHNDLEEVGHDTYHHTMFEMLGNWSFGDYFKEEALTWAWELLTDVYKIDKDRLYVTVFGGDKQDGLAPDEEAKAIWRRFVPEERILYGSKKDNFWEMGDTGPCGPCSEIHVDLRSEADRAALPGADLVNNDHPRVIEIWNNVFMEFLRKADGSLEKLPAQHVDTGMGFERLCQVIQGKESNYDTDVFEPLIAELELMTGKKRGESEAGDVAFRVIADHIRAVAFTIADGQLPSNGGAGYVIRRILRRAVRYGYSSLGCTAPFMHRLVAVLAREMGDFFPEIRQQQKLVTQVIQEEEAAFLRTLEQGLRLLDDTMAQLPAGGVVDGAKAFSLYDTFGFPLDLTSLILRERGFGLDETGFQSEMTRQKERSRAATAQEMGDWMEVQGGENSRFVGYDQVRCDARVVRYRSVQSAKGKQIQVVLDQTPFYAESGGQVGDRGVLHVGADALPVVDTKKETGQVVHYVAAEASDWSAPVRAEVDAAARTRTAAHHSATHLLHAALRTVLGTHVEQKGSLVSPDGLRFDFAHFQKVGADELAQVEALVNAEIRANHPLLEDRASTLDAAKARGAMALFGEKYGDTVRVIQFGDSIELCGGTHVSATGSLGLVKITSESAVASGVRRLEAVAGGAAEEWVNGRLAQYKSVQEALNNAQKPVEAVLQLKEENAVMSKQLELLQREKAAGLKSLLLAQAETVSGIRFMSYEGALDGGAAKDLCFALKAQPASAIFLAVLQDDKVNLHLAVSDDLVARGAQINQWIKSIAAHVQGGGGGQPFYASAGGKNPSGISAARDAFKNQLSQL
jgi:alanyl-tRNA synthetase